MITSTIHQSDIDNQWYAAFIGGNHEVWYISEGYPSSDIALNSVCEFYERLGATNPVNVKLVDKEGTVIFTTSLPKIDV